jgi:hypothetical protein
MGMSSLVLYRVRVVGGCAEVGAAVVRRADVGAVASSSRVITAANENKETTTAKIITEFLLKKLAETTNSKFEQ